MMDGKNILIAYFFRCDDTSYHTWNHDIKTGNILSVCYKKFIYSITRSERPNCNRKILVTEVAIIIAIAHQVEACTANILIIKIQYKEEISFSIAFCNDPFEIGNFTHWFSADRPFKFITLATIWIIAFANCHDILPCSI